ncbi:MAG: hypothetical protein DRJ28_10010, partial [Actinobacteria bacterium]
MTIDTESQTSGQQPELFPETPGDSIEDVAMGPVQRRRRNRPVLGALAMVVIGLLAGLLLATSLTSDPTITIAGPTATTSDSLGGSVAFAAAAVAPSVVQIETPTGLGSGVIYRSDGLLL